MYEVKPMQRIFPPFLCADNQLPAQQGPAYLSVLTDKYSEICRL